MPLGWWIFENGRLFIQCRDGDGAMKVVLVWWRFWEGGVVNVTGTLELRCWKGDSMMMITEVVEVDLNLLLPQKYFHHRTISRLNLRKIANSILPPNYLTISIDD